MFSGFEMFSEVGGFDPELLRNQDEMNSTCGLTKFWLEYFILIAGYKDQLFFQLKIPVAKISQCFYQYGISKPLVNWKLKTFAKLPQFLLRSL